MFAYIFNMNRNNNNTKLIRITVYLTKDYSISEDVYVYFNEDKQEITKQINEKFDNWFSYDII